MPLQAADALFIGGSVATSDVPS